MTAKWSGIASNSTAGNRLLNIGMCATHLSTGDLVQLVWDPSLTLPNQITLQVVTTHTSPSVVGFLSQDIFQAGVAAGASAGYPQSLAMCRDASDNIYVFGGYAVAPYGFQIVCQAFVKQSGLAWTQAAATFTATQGPPPSGTGYAAGLSAVWCNTGGGAAGTGHILVIANDVTGQTRYQTLVASKLLAGTPGGLPVSWGYNPAFLWVNGDTMTAGMGSNIDMDANGFGAPSGLSISAGNLDLGVGTWGVSSTGVLVNATMLQPGIGPITLTTSTKAMIVNYNNNRWAAIYPSTQNAGQLTITGFNGSGLAVPGSNISASSVDSGTPTNFPLPSATLNWGAIAGPPNSNTVWIYGWSTATNTTMLRVPVVFTPAGVPSITPANIVTDDTSIGAVTNTTIRVVDDVVDFQHADYQAFNTTGGGTLSLLGDYSTLPAAPMPVTLVSPVDNALAPVTGTYTWTYNPAFPGDAQVTYYFRRALQPGSAYQWWTGAAWQSTEIAITSAVSSLTFSGTNWTAGSVYSWSVDVTGTSGIRAGYASPQFVGISNTVPAAPTLVASYDGVNNRTVLTLTGSGTDSALFEFSDDGVNWFNVRGATAVVQVSGTAIVYDWEIPANGTRSYRAAQWTTAGIGSLPSAWSATVTAQSVLTTFCLRDPLNPTNWVNPHVLSGTMQTGGVLATSFNENLAEHQLLGRADTVIIGDVIGLEDGSCTFQTQNAADDAALMALLLSQSTLLFQSPDSRNWYVRWNVPRPIATPYLVRPGSYREHAVSFRGQQRPPS